MKILFNYIKKILTWISPTYRLLTQLEQSNRINSDLLRENNHLLKKLDSRTEYMAYSLETHIDNGFFEIKTQMDPNFVNRKLSFSKYSSDFYTSHKYGSYKSAVEILRVVLQKYKIKSVIDFGCGVGTWLCVAKQYGVSEVLGVDGEYVDKNDLMIENSEFLPYDLNSELDLNRTFDLAMSLECIEHIPDENSEKLIDSLCNCSNVVLFSGAQPGQGGRGHVNERPIAYWAEKFETRGYKLMDILKDEVDYKIKAEPWYLNNIVLYIKDK